MIEVEDRTTPETEEYYALALDDIGVEVLVLATKALMQHPPAGCVMTPEAYGRVYDLYHELHGVYDAQLDKAVNEAIAEARKELSVDDILGGTDDED